MKITLDIPDELLPRLVSEGTDPARALLAHVAANAYREELIGSKHIREMMGFGSRIETDEFIHRHKVTGYTAEDLRSDMEGMDRLREQKRAVAA